jgi:uncharacterized protein YoxC
VRMLVIIVTLSFAMVASSMFTVVTLLRAFNKLGDALTKIAATLEGLLRGEDKANAGS